MKAFEKMTKMEVLIFCLMAVFLVKVVKWFVLIKEFGTNLPLLKKWMRLILNGCLLVEIT